MPSDRVPSDRVPSGVEHRNEVLLIGRIAQDPLPVLLPSGDSVVTLRLIVQRPRPAAGRGSRMRVDTVNCAAWSSRLRRTVSRWRAGDTVEVSGALRRRFWRSPQGAESRYEVEMASGRRLARAGSAAAENDDRD